LGDETSIIIDIEVNLPKGKKSIGLDDMHEMTKQFTPEFYKKKQDFFIAHPLTMSQMEKQIKFNHGMLIKYEKLFTENKSGELKKNIDISEEIYNQAGKRNIEWVRKVINYLEQNPTKSIAIIVGAGHIFGMDNKEKKNGPTLPNLLMKTKGVFDVKYDFILN
jgi:uncharacterized protein YbaP (TraB family)